MRPGANLGKKTLAKRRYISRGERERERERETERDRQQRDRHGTKKTRGERERGMSGQ